MSAVPVKDCGHDSEDFHSFVAGEGVVSRKFNILGKVLQGFTAGAERGEIPQGRTRTVPLFKVSSREREYELSKPLAVKIYALGELTVAENVSLQMLTYGENPRDALASFAETFDLLYHEVVETDPARLSGNARELCRALRTLVVSVS